MIEKSQSPDIETLKNFVKQCFVKHKRNVVTNDCEERGVKLATKFLPSAKKEKTLKSVVQVEKEKTKTREKQKQEKTCENNNCERCTIK